MRSDIASRVAEDSMPEQPSATEYVRTKQAAFHAPVVEEVATAIRSHDVVVVGMSLNPHVRRARKALDDAGVAHHYIEYGGYLNMWKQRLAIKLWSGWPTFPQVFVKGSLIGGANETSHMLESGELQALRDG